MLAVVGIPAGAGSLPIAVEEIPAAAQAAFDRYVEQAGRRFERQTAAPEIFLDLRTWGGEAREEAHQRLSRGEIWIRSLRRIDREMAEIDPGDGIIHHWIGTTWVEGATIEEALDISRDFKRYPEIYAPEVVRAEVLQRSAPDDWTVAMRFRKKKVITVTIDSEQQIRFVRATPESAWSIAQATRSVQIDDAGEPDERPKPPVDGFLWDLYSSWRFEEADGGLYVEHESVILTRKPPFLTRLVAGSLINDGPREGVEFAIGAFRRELEAR